MLHSLLSKETDGKSVEELVVGDVVADMQDMFAKVENISPLRIIEPHKFTKFIRVRMPGGTKFIEESVRKHGQSYSYHNKSLVIIEEPEWHSSQVIIKAAWSWDGMSFGLAEIVVYL